MWTIRFAKSRMRENRTSGVLWGVYDRKGCTYSTHKTEETKEIKVKYDELLKFDF